MEGASGVCDAGVEGHEDDAPSLLLVPLLLKAVDVAIETTLSNDNIKSLLHWGWVPYGRLFATGGWAAYGG